MTTSAMIVSLSLAKFSKELKSINLSSIYTGNKMHWGKIFVESHITGKIMEFVPMPYDHPLHDQDGWDGEVSGYIPVTDIPNVRALFVSNAY